MDTHRKCDKGFGHDYRAFPSLAYGGLIVPAILEVLIGIFRVVGAPDTIDADALRHIYLAGLVSSLLIGMALRMVPGFRAPACCCIPLVGVAFWLWAVGSSMRILLLLLEPLFLLRKWSPTFPPSASASPA